MKAIRFYGRNDIRFEDNVPIPDLETADEVLIEVGWCGICGSDLKEIADGPIFFPEHGAPHEITGKKSPMALGHEISGTVRAVGTSVMNVKPGDRVVIEPTASCKDRKNYKERLGDKAEKDWCAACKKGASNICEYLGLCGLGSENGGLAEYLIYGSDHVFKIPDTLPLDIAALIQPLAVSWHAMEVARFQKGQTALIIGAGPIGLGLILVLQAVGASQIVCSEPAENRRLQAEKLGAQVFDPTKIDMQETVKFQKLSADGKGFDTSFDCSGFPITYRTSIDSLRPKGVAVNVAVWSHKPVSHYVMDLTYQEKIATGSMCYTTEDFENVVRCFENGSIDTKKAASMITSKVLLENAIKDAFDQLLFHKEKHIKILITPNNLSTN